MMIRREMVVTSNRWIRPQVEEKEEKDYSDKRVGMLWRVLCIC